MSSLLNDPEVKAEIQKIRETPNLPVPADLEVPTLDMSLSRVAVLENVKKVVDWEFTNISIVNILYKNNNF